MWEARWSAEQREQGPISGDSAQRRAGRARVLYSGWQSQCAGDSLGAEPTAGRQASPHPSS